jgi:hypothetical protein
LEATLVVALWVALPTDYRCPYATFSAGIVNSGYLLAGRFEPIASFFVLDEL